MSKPDPHADLAKELGLTREQAKLTNYATAYPGLSLGHNIGVGKSIMRCHAICRIWSNPWGAASTAKWEWLSQGQEATVEVAIRTIRKFLPSHNELFDAHMLEAPLALRERLMMARGIIDRATGAECFSKVEELLRPLAYIFEKEGIDPWK